MKSKKIALSKLKGPYAFNNNFEKRLVYEYLVNLINSPFVAKKPCELISCAGDAIGHRMFITLILKKYPSYIDGEKITDFLGRLTAPDELPDRVAKCILREDMLPLLSGTLARLRKSTPIDKKFDNLQALFDLTCEERLVIEFFFLKDASELVNSNFDKDDRIGELSKLPTLLSLSPYLFGVKKWRQGNSFSAHRKLFRFGFIEEKYSRQYQISASLSSILVSSGTYDFTREYFSRVSTADLPLSAFNVPSNELSVLKTLLQAGKQDLPQNFLVFGAQGTGKSSFVHSLAKELGRELLVVKIPENDDSLKARMTALYATLQLANRNELILVDEAEEILSSVSVFYAARASKAAINNLLDTQGKKVFWILNHTEGIDASTMRRFAFSLEFKKFNTKNRFTVLKHELRRRKLEGVFNDNELLDLCQTFRGNADGIVNAISALQLSQPKDKDAALDVVKTILRNNEKAISGGVPSAGHSISDSSYILDALNTSHPLSEVIRIARKFMADRDGTISRTQSALSLLLYGYPGTGKSEFVYYLGKQLGKEVNLKRVSDIHEMYVGQTEKNIARAFKESEEEGTILFFDEADSFLFPRKDAVRSWEKNFTNECLAQLDRFKKGVIVFATNFYEGLDHAALRRFTFKIEFKRLTPEKTLAFYERLLIPLVPGGSGLTEEQQREILSLQNLTPGDFATVKNQFHFVESDLISNEKLISVLKTESRMKNSSNRAIGF